VQTIWLSPTAYVTGDPSLRISYPFVSHPSTVVTCISPGDLKWVSMGLPLPPNVQIKEVIICHQLSNSQSFISQVRLAEMTTPNQAVVRHDDPTDLKSTSPTSYSSKVANFTPSAAVTLELRLNFHNTTDRIMLGAVGVTIDERDTDSWWHNAETYHISAFAIAPGENGQFDWDTLAQSKATFTTHCPIDNVFISRCHAMGIRCFPYVTFYMGADQCSFGPILSQTYEGVDFSQHHDFYEYEPDPQGPPGTLRPRQWIFEKTTPDGVGVTFLPTTIGNTIIDKPILACPNVQAYQQKMMAWVDYVMKQGADGIFIDVLLKRQHCYAPHAHIFPDDPNDPDAAQNKAFAILLSRVRDVVKSNRPNGLIIGNSGDPLNLGGNSPPEFQKYLDADMLEAYICQASPDKTKIIRADTYNNMQFTWNQFGDMLQAYLAQGKKVLVIPVLGDPSDHSVRDDAFLTYSAARLAGFFWYGPMTDSRIADLHRIRLGKAVTGPATDQVSGVRYRVFERALVAVNWDRQNAKNLPGQSVVATSLGKNPQEFRFFFDVFPAPAPTTIDMNLTGGMLAIPTYAGRVYFFGSSTDYGLNRLT
jgi:hypothetical protein